MKISLLSERSARLWGVAGGIATVLGLLLTLVFAFWVPHGSGQAAGQSPGGTDPHPPNTAPTPGTSNSAAPARDATPTHTAAAPPAATMPGPGGGTASPAGPLPDIAYLSDETPFPGSTPDTTEIPYLAGLDTAAHSLSTGTGGCARNQDNTFSYRISKGYALFRTTLAVQGTHQAGLPNKVIRALLTISIDDKTALSQLVTVGQQVRVSLSVTGHAVIALRQQYRGDYPNICYTPATVFWADARFTTS